jgi:hypothetical protein
MHSDKQPHRNAVIIEFKRKLQRDGRAPSTLPAST